MDLFFPPEDFSLLLVFKLDTHIQWHAVTLHGRRVHLVHHDEATVTHKNEMSLGLRFDIERIIRKYLLLFGVMIKK